jgi:hypothetical protein
MRVLLDGNIPAGLHKLLPGHEATLPTDVGLAGVSNGELLTAAEKLGYEMLLTADRNLGYQQNLTGRASSRSREPLHAGKLHRSCVRPASSAREGPGPRFARRSAVGS